MELPSELKQAMGKLQEVDQQQQVLWEARQKANKEMRRLLCKAILDENLLEQMEWHLHLTRESYSHNNIYVRLESSDSPSCTEQIRECLSYSSLEIWEDEELGIATVELNIDHDDDWNITFDCNQTAVKFLESRNLKIKTSSHLKNTIGDLRQEKEAIESVLTILESLQELT